MKTTTKLKIWGFIQLILGMMLIVSANTVFAEEDIFGKHVRPEVIVPGILLVFISIIIIFAGFAPELTSMSAKVQSESVQYAKDELEESISATSTVVAEGIKPAVKETIIELRQEDVESQLINAKSLFEQKLISESEYQELKKRILGIK
ncbi:hypothetical protein [Acholeplasma hippikon]|uniref:SHOCT domain-containing protein n=1 Tax=Acholeplasma hippikon TaxID=264636 RepID=A0A449BK57_9MOLU|nr:hypothetical protein [Acholeplasma hippikon]VEU82829.1 Uncharacterised protein [Acholeplasma hippikon]